MQGYNSSQVPVSVDVKTANVTSSSHVKRAGGKVNMGYFGEQMLNNPASRTSF